MPNETQQPDAFKQIEISLMPLLITIASNIQILILVPLAFTALAFAYSKLTDPIYVATTRILPPQYNENTISTINNQFGGQSQFGNSALTLDNPTDLFIGVLHSQTIRDAVIDRMNLLEYYGANSRYQAAQRFAGSSEIRAGKDGIVSISVEDTDPQMSAKLANAYVEEFYELSSRLAQQEAKRRTAFFERAMDSARQSLLMADMDLAQLERRTGFTSLSGQDEAIIQSAAELRAQISAREVQLRTMSSYATQSNPDVKLIEEEISNLRRELQRLKLNVSMGSGEPFVELGRVPEVFMEHTRSKREVEYWEDKVSLLGQFVELGKIDDRRDMSLFQVLDPAIAPESKSKPRTMVNMLLAAIGSGAATLLWILMATYVHTRRATNRTFDKQWNELLTLLIRFGRAPK